MQYSRCFGKRGTLERQNSSRISMQSASSNDFDAATASSIVSQRVKLLTFNTWGLKWVSKHRRERLKAIADELAGDIKAVSLPGSHILSGAAADGAGRQPEDYDVVALQEIWCKEDWDYIVERCSHKYPYYRSFYSGMLSGPGLAILSRIPIESTFLYRFPINGRPSAFYRGDWYVGKSIAITLLEPVAKGAYPLAIMNSHMHAPYARTGDAAYYCHRACQAWDFSKLANLYKKAGYAVVIVGDLNSRPHSLQHKFLTIETGLVDSWEQLHGKQDNLDLAVMSPMEQLKYGCTTCDSTLNTWRPRCNGTDACRLDYALIDPYRLRTVDAGVRFTERIPNIGSFSDHFAYTCTFEMIKKHQEMIRDESALLNDRYENYLEMLECIRVYMGTAKKQKLFRGMHFLLSVFLLIGAMVVTTFTANRAAWSSIFWVLFAIIVSVTGTIDGLISFLFGRKEIRSLIEVEHEVLDAKASLRPLLKQKNSSLNLPALA